MMEHRFWSQQPVGLSEKTAKVADYPLGSIPKEPYALPEGYNWHIFDIHSSVELQGIHDFLLAHYVEGYNYKLHYTERMLKWMISPPGYEPNWHLCVRRGNGQIVACITAIPITVWLNGETVLLAEVNLLCVHRNFREKRLAPVMIKEISRRIKLCSISGAIHTAVIELPHSIAQCKVYHRVLNVRKLDRLGFFKKKLTLAGEIKRHSLPVSSLKLRPLKATDVPTVCARLNAHLKTTFSVAAQFGEDEFVHVFLKDDSVVTSLVTEELDQFVSFYSMPSDGLTKNESIETAYLFYWFTKSEAAIDSLIIGALNVATQKHFDLFNCMSIMGNPVDRLGFKEGTGVLNYYAFNWVMPRCSNPNMVGLILM